MEVIEASTWDEFEDRLGKLRQDLGRGSSRLLFRGQGSSEWKLSTTLERAGYTGMPFHDYYRLISRVRPAIETLTGVNWEIPEYSLELAESLKEYDEFHRFPSVSLYRYMVYLRHHGFPSPLLDWSCSPYVAAFFAFRELLCDVSKRSVFVFCEMPSVAKVWSSEEPSIRGIGPYIRSHRRHFRQQCDYTICGRLNGQWEFSPHEDVFARSDPDQDVLWKFDLPSSERVRVLRLLNDYNLNAFSLFDSEESLMETAWLREVVFKEHGPLL
ncbi:MAG: FRG domain-containing protein [Terriglobales bacterium]